MTTKAEDSDSDIWLEEGAAEPTNQATRRRRPVGSENDVEKLVQSISSDDLWYDDDTDDENSNGRKSWRRTSGKTYHDPTVDTIHEMENANWNYYDGGSSEGDEVTTSGNYVASPTSQANLPQVINEPSSSEILEKEATSMPILILRYFRSKGENKEENLKEIENQEPSTSHDQSSNDVGQGSTVQNETEKNGEIEIKKNTDEENIPYANEKQPYFVRLAEKIFRRGSKKKDIQAANVDTDQPKFCPLCGQSLDGVIFQEGSVNVSKQEETPTFEARLTNAKMWRAVWVSLEDTPDKSRSGNKLYRTELHVDLEGNKTLSEGVRMGEKIELARFISS